MNYLYLILTVVLDKLLHIFLPYNYNNLSILTPLLLLSSLLILVFIFDKRKYYIFSFILGLLVDLVYGEYLINVFIFLIIAIIIERLVKRIKINVFNILLIEILIIVIYEGLLFFLLSIAGVINSNIYFLFYKIINSLFINILFIYLSILLFRKDILR